MNKVWIGDFRCAQLETYLAKIAPVIDTSEQSEAPNSTKHILITESSADFSWLDTQIKEKLSAVSATGTEAVIMLGFNDCVASCTWGLSIDQIAQDYATLINSLIEQFKSITFYVCSVNPVDGNYPSTSAENGVLTSEVLNNVIKTFNSKLKLACNAEFIDSYTYLTSTSFKTRDGIRYSNNTCMSLVYYILNKLKEIASTVFIPRFEAPDLTIPESESDSSSDEEDYTMDGEDAITFPRNFWITAAGGGLAPPFPIPKNAPHETATLPNCTAYAWGRFYEILGERPKVVLRNAEHWFVEDNDGYKRGDTPAEGAIICWRSGEIGGEDASAAGHVGIVEYVSEDGTEIVTSESGWESDFWWLTKRTHNSRVSVEYQDGEFKTIGSVVTCADNSWGAYNGQTFQGFIYNPAVTATPCIDTLETDREDINKNTNTTEFTKEEMETVAKYVWNYLGSNGWSLNAVAGLLGNMQYMSTLNPKLQRASDSGFGLLQWTPKSVLTAWAQENDFEDTKDINCQLERIIWEKDNNENYQQNIYNYDFLSFSTSLDSPYILACAFAFDYERSEIARNGSSSEKENLQKERGQAADEWYRFLAPYGAVNLFEKNISLNSLKIDRLEPTRIKASFIIRSCHNCSYAIFDTDNQRLATAQLQIDEDLIGAQVVSFSCAENLRPNTEYRLVVEAISNIGCDSKSCDLTFKTPQDKPDSARNLKLTCMDQIKSVSSYFKLEADIPNYSGFWNSSRGYTKQLIVNGHCVKTKTVNNMSNISERFKINEEFNYECKVGDSIQVGIRVWVKDANNQYIYDSSAAKTTNSICLLNNSIRAYLNC